MNEYLKAYQQQMAAEAARQQANGAGAIPVPGAASPWPQGLAHWHMGYQHVPYAAWQGAPIAPVAAAPAGIFNDRFIRGLLIGAAAAYLLSNENVQRTAIKTAVRAWGLVQGGVEELKERFHDAEAEVRAETGE